MTSTLLPYWRAQIEGTNIHALRWSRRLKPASPIKRWAKAARQRLVRRQDEQTH